MKRSFNGCGHNSSNRNKKKITICLVLGLLKSQCFSDLDLPMKTNTLLSLLLGILPSTTCIRHTLYFCPILIVNPVLFSLQWNPFITTMGLQNCVGKGCTLSGSSTVNFQRKQICTHSSCFWQTSER